MEKQMMTVNIFKGYTDCTPQEIPLEEIVRMIGGDTSLRDRTEKHRYYLSQNLDRAAKTEKTGCPCFAVAVRFDGGKSQKHIVSFTGMGLTDVDNLKAGRVQALFEAACQDPHTLLAYVTVSGRGLRILYRYQAEGMDTLTLKQRIALYRLAFESANNHYEQLLGVKTDRQCKDCIRLSGMAFHPQVFYRPEAEPFIVEMPAGKSASRTAGKRKRNVPLSRAVPAVEAILADEGLVYEAHHRNEYIMRTGYLLNAFGVAQDEAQDWAIGRFADYDGDILAIFKSCYRNTDEHGSRKLPPQPRARTERIAWASVEDIEAFLAAEVRLRFNTIRHQCEVCWPDADGNFSPEGFVPITDFDENTLWCRMMKSGKDVHLKDIRNVINSEFVVRFNPFEDYFHSLPPWDGVTDHIGILARSVHVKGDQELFVEYFRKWLVGILPGLFEAEVVNHEIMAFVGPQGNFKSTFFALLLPPPLQSYFNVKINNELFNKDDTLSLSEFALICLEEIEELRPAVLSRLKAMVTAKNISERAAYARNKEQRRHIASFCATGNNPHFLSDPTDNRRWLVVEVEDIDNPYQHPFDYTGIYSQAWALWKGGFRYWFDREEILRLNQRNRQFEVINLEEEAVLTYFRVPTPECKALFMKTVEILERINANLRQPLSPTKLGIILKRLGFPMVRRHSGRGYLVIERSYEEIQATRRLDGVV